MAMENDPFVDDLTFRQPHILEATVTSVTIKSLGHGFLMLSASPPRYNKPWSSTQVTKGFLLPLLGPEWEELNIHPTSHFSTGAGFTQQLIHTNRQ